MVLRNPSPGERPEKPVPPRGRPDPGETRPRRTPNQRAQAVKAALEDHKGERFTIHTPAGTVTIDRAEVVTDPDTGQTVVEVHASEFADPHIRVINPPRYVPDPNGDIELAGQRFREDPLAALAHIVALHGGLRRDPRRGT